MIRQVLLGLSLAAVVSGCSMLPYYSQVKAVADTGIATAVEDRKGFNDKKLAINVVALCDNSIGAVGRYPDAQVRDFINRMCQPAGSTVTMDQLKSVLDLIQPQAPIVLAPAPEEVPVDPLN